MTDDEKWAACAARDRGSDGRFVTAVHSTGIYCRPSCPAKRPRRENVSFHADAASARAAGFRACLRCRPDAVSREVEAVAAACRAMDAAESAPDLAALAAAAGLSPSHFHRLFRRATGLTPRGWWAARRAERARAALQDGHSVTDAIHAAGYGSNGRFYADAGERLGMTPRSWRNGGAGERLFYAFGNSSLGRVLVASTARGVASIMLGDDADVLLADLRARFPRAELTPGDDGFAVTVAAAVRLVERPGEPADLPLDIRGTAFQERVWAALRGIPAGQTLSYAELARRLDAPTAVRAVAGACAANKIAVAIPCHRVVGADGRLTGYRWGTDRKRALLEREASGPPGAPPRS